MTLDLQKVKADWIAALRSGKYERGKSRLMTVTPDGNKLFCCLGVLCDVVNPDGWSQDPLYAGPNGEVRTFHYGETTAVAILSDTMAEDLKLPHWFQQKLAARNDGGYTADYIAREFDAQADYIEEHWNP